MGVKASSVVLQSMAELNDDRTIDSDLAIVGFAQFQLSTADGRTGAGRGAV